MCLSKYRSQHCNLNIEWLSNCVLLTETEHLATIPDPRQLILAQRRQTHLAIDAEHGGLLGHLLIRVASEDKILVLVVLYVGVATII